MSGIQWDPDFRRAIEAALRSLITNLDYDLHKSIKCNEEDGSDGYPNVVEDFLKRLARELSEEFPLRVPSSRKLSQP